jgi:phage terminase large subunit-like protein
MATRKSSSGRSTRSTTSRASIRADRRAPSPFTVEHFKVYAGVTVLDNGEWFDVQEFQQDFLSDLFAGYPEAWLILPEGNGKTTFLGELALYYGDYTPNAMVPIAASSREQAEILYRQAAGIVQRSPELRSRFRAYDGYRRIKCHRTDGRIQVFAADDRTGDGIIPGGLAIVEELHRHRDLRLYRTWRGKLGKRGAQLAGISTAGEPGGEFEEVRSRMIRDADAVRRDHAGCRVRAVSEEHVIHDFSVPSLKQAEDMDVVARANPLAQNTVDVLRRARQSPTMTREHWLRFKCNLATLTGGSAIQPETWDALAEPGVEVAEGAWRCGWLDLGWKIDTTALGVLAWESLERRVVTGVRVLEPPVDESSVVAGILRTQIDFGANVWVLDPSAGAEQMVQLLEKGQHPLQTDDVIRAEHDLPPLTGHEPPLEFIAHSQDNAPMGQAASRLDEAVRNGWLVHDGDRRLRAHVLNAVARSLGDAKWKFDRPADAKGDRRKNYPIDALTGVLMGHNIAVEESSSSWEPMAAWA